jgi:hypothetical protein
VQEAAHPFLQGPSSFGRVILRTGIRDANPARQTFAGARQASGLAGGGD